VPLQGSGTFAVEAAIGTLVPRDGKVLVLINGAYGKRLAKICEVLGRSSAPSKPPKTNRPPPPTSTACCAPTGHHPRRADPLRNQHRHPQPAAGDRPGDQAHGKRLIIDAMSSFGALPIDAREVPFEALIAAPANAWKACRGWASSSPQNRPGRRQGNCHSLAMDLFDQHAYMAKTGQWRFTPPTHVVAALHEALLQYNEEGGLPARHQRYADNCQALLDGMAELGLRSFLPAAIQAPIIVTFHAPKDPRYQFKDFYERVKAKGFILYPGKLTQVETFRVGCIGHVGPAGCSAAVTAVAEVLRRNGSAGHLIALFTPGSAP
jgi:2-aminoethylphosphonate-pyruvate transaminase